MHASIGAPGASAVAALDPDPSGDSLDNCSSQPFSPLACLREPGHEGDSVDLEWTPPHIAAERPGRPRGKRFATYRTLSATDIIGEAAHNADLPGDETAHFAPEQPLTRLHLPKSEHASVSGASDLQWTPPHIAAQRPSRQGGQAFTAYRSVSLTSPISAAASCPQHLRCRVVDAVPQAVEEARDRAQRALRSVAALRVREAPKESHLRVQRRQAQNRSELEDFLVRHVQTGGERGLQGMSAAEQPPLHLACSLALPRVVYLLLLEGSDARHLNAQGQTAAEVAHSCNQNGSHDQVLDILRRHGVDSVHTEAPKNSDSHPALGRECSRHGSHEHVPDELQGESAHQTHFDPKEEAQRDSHPALRRECSRHGSHEHVPDELPVESVHQMHLDFNEKARRRSISDPASQVEECGRGRSHEQVPDARVTGLHQQHSTDLHEIQSVSTLDPAPQEEFDSDELHEESVRDSSAPSAERDAPRCMVGRDGGAASGVARRLARPVRFAMTSRQLLANTAWARA